MRLLICSLMRVVVFAVLVSSLLLPATASAMDGRLAYLIHQHEKNPDKTSPVFTGTLRFSEAPTEDLFRRMEALGVEFFDFGKGPAGSRTVFPARIPFAVLEALAVDPDVANIDCSWRPGRVPPLVITRPWAEADPVWELRDEANVPVTGEGVIIADLDSGVDVTHPMLFALSDQVYDWLDTDDSGGPTNGDAIDLDGDGMADPGEILGIYATRYTGVQPVPRPDGTFYTNYDFLFLDENLNGQRDGGAPEFVEADLTYGERLFLAVDSNGNDLLDLGEQVQGLGQSKVRAILERDGTVRRRGLDLLANEGDYWSHGTSVSAIAAGGWAGMNAMSGMAPGAELVFANMEYLDDPPFTAPFAAKLAWAQYEGADIILIEDGTWVWQYMDGSSNLELMLNEMAADDGTIIVSAAGNLCFNSSHTDFAADQEILFNIDHDIDSMWFTFLWRGEDGDWDLTYTPPEGSPITIPRDGSEVLDQDTHVWGHRSQSHRGTWRQDVRLAPEEQPWVDHTIGTFSGQGPAGVQVQAFHFDHETGWGNRFRFFNPTRPGSVAYPATADSVIVVAAQTGLYDSRHEIAFYSGVGPRIDGYPLLDLAAPSGVWTASPFDSADFNFFRGTSCAAPFVAGAAALLKQLFPDLDHAGCRWLLRRGATREPLLEDPHMAGAGRLRVYHAVALALADASDTPQSMGISVSVYPNPFNAEAIIRFTAKPGTGVLRIFDVRGHQVYSRRLDFANAGQQDVHWRGVDDQGQNLASGVYFCYVRQGQSYGVQRMALVK